MPHVHGLHHVTATASDPQRTLDFYADVLGLRLVKLTVNFDAPHTYHLYFGDEVGRPGTLLTLFPIPRARQGRAGAGQTAVVSFSVPTAALRFWTERLTAQGVGFEPPTDRTIGSDEERVLAFRDPDGMRLELVGHAAAADRDGWPDAPDVPAEHAIRGVHAVTLWQTQLDETASVLEMLGLQHVAQAGAVHRFAAADGAPGTLVDVRVAEDLPRAVGGAGTIHHIALGVADEADQLALRERVARAGHQPTPVIDRSYFRSVYLREPGGVLLELATLGPGMDIDEPVEALGGALRLPPQHEPRRAEIEAALPALRLPGATGEPV